MRYEEREFRVYGNGRQLGLVHASTCRQAYRMAASQWPRQVKSVKATCPKNDGQDYFVK